MWISYVSLSMRGKAADLKKTEGTKKWARKAGLTLTLLISCHILPIKGVYWINSSPKCYLQISLMKPWKGRDIFVWCIILGFLNFFANVAERWKRWEHPRPKRRLCVCTDKSTVFLWPRCEFLRARLAATHIRKESWHTWEVRARGWLLHLEIPLLHR